MNQPEFCETPRISPSSAAVNLWLSIRDQLLKDAPADIRQSFEATGLHVPACDEDYPGLAFEALEQALPPQFFAKEVIDPAASTPATVGLRAVAASLFVHANWRRMAGLKQLEGRTDQFENTRDRTLWAFCVLDLAQILIARMLGDLTEILAENALTGWFGVGDILDTDSLMLKVAEDAYMEALQQWKNEEEAPPFTRDDARRALVIAPETPDTPIGSLSGQIGAKARHLMAIYGISYKDARLAVACAESTGHWVKVPDSVAVEAAV